MLGKCARTIALTGAIALGAGSAAEAAIGDGVLGARQALANATQIENAQFIFGGQNYCWYDDGWRGPGWDWCGYANRSGLGWGGGGGWDRWGRGGRRQSQRPRRGRRRRLPRRPARRRRRRRLSPRRRPWRRVSWRSPSRRTR